MLIPAVFCEAAPEKGPNKSIPARVPNSYGHCPGEQLLQNEAEISKTRSLPKSWAPPLPLTFQKSTQRNTCHGLLASSLILLISLTVTCCDLVRMRKDRRASRFQVAWGRRGHGVAIPGYGTMMQDREQHQHQPYHGCYQVHEQCCWTLLSADMLCLSTSGAA